jgi:hypothetical protein
MLTLRSAIEYFRWRRTQKPEWREPRLYELLFLPAPPRVLLLSPPRDIKVGSFVRFTKKFCETHSGSDWGHWAKVYGNGVGIVLSVHVWDKMETTARVAFPHRTECWGVSSFELDHNADRAMAVLKWGPTYGPRLRLRQAPQNAASS